MGRAAPVGSRKSAVGKSAVGQVGSDRRARGATKQSPLELDRLIHERLRLGIISALAVNDRLTFNDLEAPAADRRTAT